MWSIPNDNPEGRAFFVVTIVFIVISMFVFGLRIYSRRLHKSSFDASDYSCLLGVVLNIGMIIIIFGVYAHGWGQDISLFTLEDGYFAASTFVAIDIVWNAAAVSIRASMLLLYIRIFAVRQFRIICWAFLAVNLCILLSVILAATLICKPITYSFVPLTPGGHCGSLSDFEMYTAISSLITDFVVVALPMPMLWKLQMKHKKKSGLAFVFGMGLLICVLTFIRILISRYYEQNNYTKQAAIVGLITALEPIIGVTCACLPFLPLVFVHIGKSKIFSRISTIVTPTNRTSETESRVNGIRADPYGQFRGLENVQMTTLNGFGGAYISAGRNDDLHERSSDDSGMFRNETRILVRKDFSVESQIV